MRDADKMTVKELRELANQKELEQRNTGPTVVKTAELKRDMYCYIDYYYSFGSYLTAAEMKKEIRQFQDSFHLLKKGTKFEFWQYPDGYGYWIDYEGEFELDEEDAKRFLIHIKPVKAK